jgi:photosystem II stability/assembly factor-like uncharacterized protein
MNDDEKFQREVRGTLHDLAREPAPDRLVTRVSEIPSREPSTWTGGIRQRVSSRSLGSAFGLLAVGVAIVAVAVLARPGAIPPGVGASPSAPVGTTVPAASTPAPSSSAAVATPAPTPQGAKVPAGFQPVSATFVSSADGWVLGSIPCSGARCPAIVRTTDGGSTWSAIGAPRTKMGNGSLPGLMNGTGISGLRFANASNGWAFGPELWATHDGGATWARVVIAGLPATAAVAALEAAHGSVHAVAYDGDHDFRIATSAIRADDWRLADVRVPVGAGPVPQIQLVLAGDAGWVLQNDRTVVNGARLLAGTWLSWDPPCLDVVGPALLAASSATDLIAVCDEGVMSTPSGEHLYSSKDGGVTFSRVGGRLPINSAVAVATPDGSTIVVAGSNASGAALLTSFDGGRTWPSTLNAGNVGIIQLGFTTKTQGLLITRNQSDVGTMLMTHDGGRTWSRVAF